MKDAILQTFKDGDTVITQRPENGCFDKNGKFIGAPEAGKEVLLDDGDEVKQAKLKPGAMHPATEA